MTKTINELSKEYDLELEKVVLEIKSLPKGEKLVLLQFPDGLKPYATAVVDYLEEKTDVIFLIWLGDCFGACDTPNLGTAGCIPPHCVPGTRTCKQVTLLSLRLSIVRFVGSLQGTIFVKSVN